MLSDVDCVLFSLSFGVFLRLRVLLDMVSFVNFPDIFALFCLVLQLCVQNGISPEESLIAVMFRDVV